MKPFTYVFHTVIFRHFILATNLTEIGIDKNNAGILNVFYFFFSIRLFVVIIYFIRVKKQMDYREVTFK